MKLNQTRGVFGDRLLRLRLLGYVDNPQVFLKVREISERVQQLLHQG